MKYYVGVLGSYDFTFVGPFDTEQATNNWMNESRKNKPQFDYYLYTEETMQANIREFGNVPIQTP